MNDDRRCANCAATDMTVAIGTSSGDDLFCARCWRETLSAAARPSPRARTVDDHIARVEQAERVEAAAE